MKLRDYQEKAITDVLETLNTHQKVMLQSPTGSGKSVIICNLIEWALQNNKRVLFCVDRKELVEQIKDTLLANKIIAGVIMSGNPTHSFLPVQIASIQTLNRRSKPKADVIIIDEAHATKSQSYQKLWDLYENATFIGLTATPYRLSGEGFTELFDTLIQTTSIKELIDNGYLVPFKHFICSVPEFDKVSTKNGEYVDNDVIDELSTAPIVESYLKNCEGKKGIAFAVNIEHSLEIAKKYQEAGINAVHVDAETPKAEREKIIKRFRAGEIKVLCNVGLFTTGFDVPDVNFVQLLRMTKSLSLYLQMIGRGSRVLKGLIDDCTTAKERVERIAQSEKTHCIILDHAGLFYEHGLGTTEHDWEMYFNRTRKDKTRKGEKEKVFAIEDEEGVIRLTSVVAETKGMTLREVTPELETLTFFEKHLQEIVSRNNKKLLSAFFKYDDFLRNQNIAWNNDLFDYVEHRLKLANHSVKQELRFNLGFLYYKRKEFLTN